MEKRSPFDPDGDPDRGSDGNPTSNGIEATRQQARIEHLHSVREMLEQRLSSTYVLLRGYVSALTSAPVEQRDRKVEVLW
jgi:hypothetical protein